MPSSSLQKIWFSCVSSGSISHKVHLSFGRILSGFQVLVDGEGLESYPAPHSGTRLLKQGVYVNVRSKLAEPNDILVQAKSCIYVHCNPKMSLQVAKSVFVSTLKVPNELFLSVISSFPFWGGCPPDSFVRQYLPNGSTGTPLSKKRLYNKDQL